MATCKECLHYELCEMYVKFGVTDVPESDKTPCNFFKYKADYVPVVRCKDCIYNKGKSVEFDNIIFCHKELPKARTLNDYCSYGERKDAE